MLVMKMRSSSPVNRLVGLYRGFMRMYKKKKKKKKKSGLLQLAVSSDWRKPAVNGYRPPPPPKKKEMKKKIVLIGDFAYYIPLWDIICAFLQDYTVSH